MTPNAWESDIAASDLVFKLFFYPGLNCGLKTTWPFSQKRDAKAYFASL